MGAAVEVFPGAQAIAVPRDRFLPVKTTNELLLVRSDAFELSEDARLRAATGSLPGVTLDPQFYKLLPDFDARVKVVPSLVEATSLRVDGDWTFDAAVQVKGVAVLEDAGAAAVVPAGSLGDG